MKDNFKTALDLRAKIIRKINALNQIPKYKRNENDCQKLAELNSEKAQVEEFLLDLARKVNVA